MKLHLIRHGQSMGNLNGENYYNIFDADIQLTSLGIQQSRYAGMRLVEACADQDEVHMWNSPYARALQTADEIDSQFVIAGRYVKRAEHVFLHERSWGSLRDLVKDRSYTPSDFRFFSRPDRGESYADLAVRVKLFLADVEALKLSKTSALICATHGDWMRVAHMILTQQSVAEFDKCRSIPLNTEIRSYDI